MKSWSRRVFFALAVVGFVGPTVWGDDTSATSPMISLGSTESSEYSSSGASEWYEGIYFSLSIGPQWRDEAEDAGGKVEFDTGIVGNVGVGYKFPGWQTGRLRVEAEYSRFHNDGDEIYPKAVGVWEDALDTEIDVNAFMGNVFYDFNIGDSNFHPYVGVGLGAAEVLIDDFETPTLRAALGPAGMIPFDENTDYRFAYQVRAGLTYQINERFDTFMGYRFFETEPKIDFYGTTLKPEATFHVIEFGLRITF